MEKPNRSEKYSDIKLGENNMTKIRTERGEFYISEKDIESFDQLLQDIWYDLDMNQNIDDWRESAESSEELLRKTLDLCEEYIEYDLNTNTIKYKD